MKKGMKIPQTLLTAALESRAKSSGSMIDRGRLERNYELGKNRAKMAQLEMAAREFPQEALFDLKRLADSIKSNETASNRKIPNTPLSQQRPSNIGTDSGNNALSMRDLKSKYRG